MLTPTNALGAARIDDEVALATGDGDISLCEPFAVPKTLNAEIDDFTVLSVNRWRCVRMREPSKLYNMLHRGHPNHLQTALVALSACARTRCTKIDSSCPISSRGTYASKTSTYALEEFRQHDELVFGAATGVTASNIRFGEFDLSVAVSDRAEREKPGATGKTPLGFTWGETYNVISFSNALRILIVLTIVEEVMHVLVKLVVLRIVVCCHDIRISEVVSESAAVHLLHCLRCRDRFANTFAWKPHGYGLHYVCRLQIH